MSRDRKKFSPPTRLGFALVTAMCVAACGGDTSKYRATRGPVGGGGGGQEMTIDPASAGSVAGKVAFEGTPPVRGPIVMSGTPECHSMHSSQVLDEKVIVNPNGTLKNCFVYVNVPGTYPPPAEKAVIDQVGCIYVPHIMGVQTGQELEIKNSDEFLHNVHFIPRENEEKNIGMPRPMSKTQVFPYPEVMIKFKCEVHPWMSAWVGVLNHPFFAVTGDDGAFDIPNVPPGTYDCVVWHEKLGEKRASITVATGQAASVEFTYQG